MMSFYFNITHPDLFAVSLYVSSQWDTTKMKEQNVRVDSASWSTKPPQAEQERLAEELIAKGGTINFNKWEAGSVLPEPAWPSPPSSLSYIYVPTGNIIRSMKARMTPVG